jgi:hypothetical protein
MPSPSSSLVPSFTPPVPLVPSLPNAPSTASTTPAIWIPPESPSLGADTTDQFIPITPPNPEIYPPSPLLQESYSPQPFLPPLAEDSTNNNDSVALATAVHHAQVLAAPKLRQFSGSDVNQHNTVIFPWLVGTVGVASIGGLGYWQREQLLALWRRIRPTATPAGGTPVSPTGTPPHTPTGTTPVLTEAEKAFATEAEQLGTTVKSLRLKRRIIKYAGMLIATVGLLGTPVGGTIVAAVQAGVGAIATSAVVNGAIGAVGTAAVNIVQVVAPLATNAAAQGTVAVVAGGAAAANPKGMDSLLRGIGSLGGKTKRGLGRMKKGVINGFKRFLII